MESSNGQQSPQATAQQLTMQLKEVTNMFQQKADELSALRREHLAMQQSSSESAAKIAALEMLLKSGGGGTGDAAQIKAKDDEIAALKAKLSTFVQKIESLEGEQTFLKRKVETAANKVLEEKEEEIASLKIMFTEISEKRKESFLQIKDRLKTASEMIQTLQAQATADANTIASLQASLDTTQRALRTKEGEVNDYVKRVHELEHEKGDLFQQNSDELQRCKNEIRELQNTVEVATAEKTKLAEKANFNETKETMQASVEMYIESDGGGGGAENGRALRCVHAFDQHSTPIQWYRSFRGSAFTPIPGGAFSQTIVYTPTVDDIGAVVKAEIIVPGPGRIPVSREFGPIGSKRAMVLSIQEAIKKGEVVFSVDSAYDADNPTSAVEKPQTAKEKEKNKPQILLNKEKIKLRAGGKTVEKAEYSDTLRVTLDSESETRFTVAVDATATPLSYAAANGTDRDLIVQTIRSFNQAMIAAANLKANRPPITPPDTVLALAYLIRAGNESRNRPPKNAHRAISGGGASAGGSADFTQGGIPPRVRQLSASSMDASQAADNSNPNTPAHRREESNAVSSSARKGSDAAAASNTAPPIAVGKIKGSNGEELEVDADGFVIRKNTGWDDAPKPEKKAGGDSDFSDEEGEEASKPTFQMKINSEARPLASGADLRRSIVDFGLANVKEREKAKKKAEKEAKKAEKKKKKASLAGGSDPANPSSGGVDEDGVQLPVGEGNADSSPSPSPTSTNSASAAYAAAAATGSTPSHQRQGTGGAGSSSTIPEAARQMNPDDLFAFLDAESASKPAPALGMSPMGKQSNPSTTPATNPPPPASNISSSMPPPSQALSAAAPPPPSTLARSSSNPEGLVDILVMETLHLRMLDGEIIEYAVWGEILLNMAVVPPKEQLFDFQIFNGEAMTKVAPNTAILQAGNAGPGSWRARIPAGTDAPLCVLKYKVSTDLNQAAKQVPLQLSVQWQCSKNATIIDVDYRMTPALKAKLLDVKFLIALQPDKCIKQCSLAVPKCMWSPQSQKMMWQLPSLPAENGPSVTNGKLHAELANNDVTATPAPLSVSFMSDDLEGVISGIIIAEGEKKVSSAALSLGRLIYRVKSGLFTVL